GSRISRASSTTNICGIDSGIGRTRLPQWPSGMFVTVSVGRPAPTATVTELCEPLRRVAGKGRFRMGANARRDQMIDKKMGLMLGAAAAAVVVLGAAAVAAIDWRGTPRTVAAAPAAEASDTGVDAPSHRRSTSRSNANFALLKFDTDHDG